MFSVILFLLLFLKPVFIFSQDLIPQYQTDLSYQQDLYNQSYDLFLHKKTVHQQYNSIATEKELIDAIKKTTQYRNSLLIAYLNLITAKLDIYKSQDSSPNTSKIQNVLNQQNIWLQNQPTKITSISNKSQLDQYNQQFSQSYKQIQQYINNALIQSQVNHQNLIISQIKNLLLKIKASPNFDSQAQNWIVEIESQLNDSTDFISQALLQVKTDNPESYTDYSDLYQETKPYLDSSKQNLFKVIENISGVIKKFI